ncbi:MAG: glycoside hydrolase family 3 C-terminal domain-containing protein, partial [Bifidobacteriaceae bacterium]|nr:glycoside hydrolase family 3 C-terminal domain-containing protein [Bifidobacteriaceae bacterium]
MTHRSFKTALPFVLAAALAATMGVGPAHSWSTSTAIEPLEARHISTAEKAAIESMVLLENNNNVLPISADQPIALFGPGALRNPPTGTGSSAMTGIRDYTTHTVERAFTDAGFTLTQSAAYVASRNSSISNAPALSYGALHTFSPPSNYSNADGTLTVETAVPTQPTDTAVYVLLRNSGETYDRVKNQSYDLSTKELNNLRILGRSYRNVVVVMCVPGVTDTSFYKTINADPAVVDPAFGQPLDALVVMGIAGQEAGPALVKLLTGQAAFSGKLADTWASDYSYYPAAATWGPNDSDSYEEVYREGIYVGYRYFDSFYRAIDPAAPQNVVNYPFGYGRSYTSFSIATTSVTANMDKVTVKVAVTNTGATHSGKEVVQVYASAPTTGLDKPYQQLIGFVKTDQLAPGQTQQLTIATDTRNLASYDPARAAYTLEGGDYAIRVGNGSRSTSVQAIVNVPATTVVEQLANEMTDQTVAGELVSNPADFYSYAAQAAEIA